MTGLGSVGEGIFLVECGGKTVLYGLFFHQEILNGVNGVQETGEMYGAYGSR